VRTWPKELLEKYPLAPVPNSRGQAKQVRERPWWTITDVVRSKAEEVLHYKIVANRSDGVHIYQNDRSFLGVSGGVVAGPNTSKLTASVKKSESWQAKRQELIEQVDAMSPLPHPGFRVGQVWAFRHKHPNTFPVESFVIVTITYSFLRELEAWIEFSGPPVQGSGPAEYLHSSKGRNLDFFLTDPEDLKLLLESEGYLLADPCCPWLAPWSGAS
jgi:hypothetical protein